MSDGERVYWAERNGFRVRVHTTEPGWCGDNWFSNLPGGGNFVPGFFARLTGLNVPPFPALVKVVDGVIVDTVIPPESGAQAEET